MQTFHRATVKIMLSSVLCLCALTLPPTTSTAQAENLPASTNIYGALGLNTVPSARMDETGTIRTGLATLDPYAHSWLSFQLAAPLSVTLRQSAEISSINKNADRLYPGVDFKLRLFKETRTRPEISLGVQSALGHKRMAGEYIVASKRYRNFDLSAGLGWGRMGSNGSFKNPLTALSSHFGGKRALDGELPSAPENWFTGSDVGLFAGLEYYTPLKGLSLKLDYGADAYKAEKAALSYNAPTPWSIGLNYRPVEWADIGLAIQGTDKIMARLSLQGNLKNMRKQNAGKVQSVIMRPHRAGAALPGEMEIAAEKNGQYLYNAQTTGASANAHLILRPEDSAPYQIGNAAASMANHAGQGIEEINITPTIMGLQGPQVRLIRRDLEKARAMDQGSAEEIWHNAEFITPKEQSPWTKRPRPSEMAYGPRDFKLSLENQISLSEEDSGALYRTSIIAGTRGPGFFGLIDTAASVRLNIKDNLSNIANLRPRAFLPVRSNEDRFAARTLGLETMYSAFTHSFSPNLHLSLLGGYLEEMYGGAGGEILYRPINARWAIGAESWLALKRDPETALNLGFNGDRLLSGHVNGWYDIPELDLTLNAKIGRYLAEDIGASIGLQKIFHNGAKLEGFATLTNAADFDLFGGTTHAYHGIKLSLPLGGYKYTPANTRANISAAPFGRDTGQALNNPMPLYALTEAFNARHMEKYWDEIAK